ncbi:phosphatidate cytidylyltransferase [Virgibacillus profundi]|uniref:Phosphatidate cytidylyltransferase n=1 Tax=Virgibacillus profundi TaxID=2024555 RepID=A0A2A2IG17_9BACI|nr:phosphatidate cytidylyltransferase [Virgibacillus profundi]PAV30033.1 phosphatidate cytidylyltransferase [Virgibacillus profundi]PXY54206.1 phosphatidate cytidylyltransferase [Virgibacillus profundi]
MKQRVITAILAIIIFLPFVIYGNLPFTLFVYVIATIGLIELMKMHKIAGYSLPSILSIGLLWIILLDNTDIIPYTWFSQTEIIMLGVMLLLSYTVLVKNKFNFDDAGFTLLSVIYVGMGFYYLIETREEGLSFVFFALFIVWATDTGAYFFGRALGKKKLWPMISPNKTVEGALGGILLACIVAVIFQLVSPVSSSMLVVIGVTVLASVFGQIGDLVESAFKRHYGVKDSGNILPGHGGILDRFDSLLFVLPLLHFVGFI